MDDSSRSCHKRALAQQRDHLNWGVSKDHGTQGQIHQDVERLQVIFMRPMVPGVLWSELYGLCEGGRTHGERD